MSAQKSFCCVRQTRLRSRVWLKALALYLKQKSLILSRKRSTKKKQKNLGLALFRLSLFVGLFWREILRSFSSFPAKRLNFFFQDYAAIILFTRERTSSLRRRVQRTTTTCDDHERICSFFEQSQQNKNKGKEVLFLLSFSVVLKECSSIS